MDIFWFLLGLVFGVVFGLTKRRTDIPKDLEKCEVDHKQLTDDLAYYKKLTRDVIAENKELRNK